MEQALKILLRRCGSKICEPSNNSSTCDISLMSKGFCSRRDYCPELLPPGDANLALLRHSDKVLACTKPANPKDSIRFAVYQGGQKFANVTSAFQFSIHGDEFIPVGHKTILVFRRSGGGTTISFYHWLGMFRLHFLSNIKLDQAWKWKNMMFSCQGRSVVICLHKKFPREGRMAIKLLLVCLETAKLLNETSMDICVREVLVLHLEPFLTFDHYGLIAVKETASKSNLFIEWYSRKDSWSKSLLLDFPFGASICSACFNCTWPSHNSLLFMFDNSGFAKYTLDLETGESEVTDPMYPNWRVDFDAIIRYDKGFFFACYDKYSNLHLRNVDDHGANRWCVVWPGATFYYANRDFVGLVRGKTHCAWVNIQKLSPEDCDPLEHATPLLRQIDGRGLERIRRTEEEMRRWKKSRWSSNCKKKKKKKRKCIYHDVYTTLCS